MRGLGLGLGLIRRVITAAGGVIDTYFIKTRGGDVVATRSGDRIRWR